MEDKTMLKTKEFFNVQTIDKEYEPLEDVINEFVEENNIKEIIDIKYNKTIEFDSYNNLYLLTSALIVYK